MTISVIIPAYNYAHFLPRTVHSVLRQELDVPVEIIVVDDGSSDNTAQVARRFAGDVVYVHQENQGLSAARNTGVAHASGEALVFLDADDLLLPGVLQSQWNMLKAAPESHISVCLNYTFTARQPGDVIQVRDCLPVPHGSPGVHICAYNVAPVHSHMLKRSLAMKAGPFDVSLRACEDYDFWLRCLMAGGEMVINPRGAVLYRKHGASMSAQQRNQLIYEAICNRRVASLLQKTPTFLPQRRLDAYMAHLMGTLNRAGKIAEHQPEMLIPLLGQCMDAVTHIVRLCLNDTSAGDMTMLGTSAPRSDAEVRVLQYYVMRALHSLATMRGIDEALESAHNILREIFAVWDTPTEDFEGIIGGLYRELYIPQYLTAVADAHGALRVQV